MTMTFEGALFSAAAFLMGLIGVTEVAAHAIALQIAAIAFQVPFGVAQAATIRVGMAYGAARPGVDRRGRTASLIVGSASWSRPRGHLGRPAPVRRAPMSMSTAANAALVALAVDYLAVAAAFQLFDGAQAVAAGVCAG